MSQESVDDGIEVGTDDDTSLTFLGPSIDEIYNGLGMFDRENQAPPIISSDSHTVLFKLPLPTADEELPVPLPGEDIWDDDHVKMPSNPTCVYSEIDETGTMTTKARWELIKRSLTEKTITTSQELEEAVKKYNTKFTSWSFTALHSLFENEFSEEDTDFFFESILPSMIDLALQLPALIQSPIPLLKKMMNHTISLSQQQAACLLANAFFCTFPRRNGGRKNSDYPEINFNRLFCSDSPRVLEKVKCILNYFRRIFISMPRGVLTFQRRYIEPASFPKWEDFDLTFSNVKLLVSHEGTIEDATSMLQVDFANRYLGGGVLGFGCVQEEIRFVINPEMIVGMLFCESMRSEESIVMTGCEQFNNYSGYSNNFKWSGSNLDETPWDKFRRKMIYVVAIDAFSFHKPHLQFEENLLRREVNKAYSGFYHEPKNDSPIPVSSGNWGCGVFRGSKTLKALIQLIACAANQRNLVYYTFGEVELMVEIHTMFEFLTHNKITIGQVWKYLKDFRSHQLTNQPEKLYSFIYKRHKNEATSDSETKIDDQVNPKSPEKIEKIEEEKSETFENPAKRAKTEEVDKIQNQDEKFEKIVSNLNERLLETTEELEFKEETDEKLNEKTQEIEEQKLEEIQIDSQVPEPEEILQPTTKNVSKITDYFKRKT